MPTPTGLPKVGEVWEYHPRHGKTAYQKPERVVVLERGLGFYWSLKVGRPGCEPVLWVDASYWLKMGWLKYIGPAGPETKVKLGLAKAKAVPRVPTNPIHITGTPENNAVVAVNVVVYYPTDTSDEAIHDDLNAALGQSPLLISAYLLVGNGFGHLVPEDDPIA